MKMRYVVTSSSNAFHHFWNTVKSSKVPTTKWKPHKIVLSCILAFYLFCAAGCSGPALSSSEQIKRFEQAGQETSVPDANRPAKTQTPYVYRVATGDVLELQMPAILQLNKKIEVKYMSSSTGAVNLIKEKAIRLGVTYWEELEQQ